jgi:hypothetical protein
MKATWNQSELIRQRVPSASDKPSKRDANLVMAAEKLAAKRHSLFTAFSGGAKQDQNPYLAIATTVATAASATINSTAKCRTCRIVN